MFTKLELLIAKRYIKTPRKESFIKVISWFSLIGITLGVAVLIIVMSVMNGFRKDLVKNIIGVEGHITVQSNQGRFIDNYESLITKLKTLKQATNVVATISTQGLIVGKGYNAGVLVKSITYPDFVFRKIKLSQANQRAINNFNLGKKDVLIGSSLARNLGLMVNDTVKLIFPEFDSTIAGFIPKHLTLKVAGVFNTGMYQYDSNMVFLPLKLGKLLYSSNSVKTLEIFIKNPSQATQVAEHVRSMLGYGFYISTWQQNNYSLISALNTERNVMFIILFLIIMIASFNIMSSLIMLVKSKTKEIAILRAIGFSQASIQKIFFIIGIRIGLIGTIAGTIIGTVFSINIEHIRVLLQNTFNIKLFNEDVYFLSHLPAHVDVAQITIIVLSSIILSTLSSVYPSWKASKTLTAKALRYE